MRTSRRQHTCIGHAHIKQRRLTRQVSVAAFGFLGDYVPFNFCPRSVMLYVIHSRSVDGFDGSQEEVVHLVSNIGVAVKAGRPWTFTDRHAELAYARYYANLSQLNQVDWSVMPLQQWGGPGRDDIKEKRQAEFLVHGFLPWTSIVAIGVKSEPIARSVNSAIQSSDYKPNVVIMPSWYY